MADSFIQVAPDSTGKMMQTYLNTIGANPVHAEAVSLVDSSGAPITTLPVSLASNVTVSGSVTANSGTNLNTALLATSAKQSDGTQKSQIVDGAGNVIGSSGNALNVNLAGTGTSNVAIVDFLGAANMFNGQVAATTTPATLVAARATRRSVTIRNINTSISVFIGNPTISSSNGLLLRAGDSISVDYTGLIQVVAGSNSPNVAFIETYD